MAAKFDVNAVLASAAKANTGAAKSKSKAPDVECDRIESQIKRWIASKKAVADAEAEMVQAENEILPVAVELRKAELRKTGKYESSIKINRAIQVVFQNKYSKIDPTMIEAFKKAFGDDEADKLVVLKTIISLTEKALNDPSIMETLVKAVGPEKFAEYFKVDQTLVPTERLHEGLALDEDLDKKAQKLVDNGILKPYKPSVRAV